MAAQGLMTGAELQARRQDTPEQKKSAEPQTPAEDTGPSRARDQEPADQSPSNRLRNLLDHHGLISGAALPSQRAEQHAHIEAGSFDIDTLVPGEVIGDHDQSFYLVRRDFPLDHRQGTVPLSAALEAVPKHIALSACDAGLEAFDPEKTLFIDTETTGLSGGTGTVAFLVGAGYFTEGVFRLEQCFMRDYDDEEPMLRYLDGIFRRCDAVVSYNGKSFDMPLLRTRFTANRLTFGLDGALHFDLVHAARRFWKLRLRDCSLGNIERVILGLQRFGDVPSAEIPQIWFDYLNSGNATRLEHVFYHHSMDILSLVSLTALLSQCLDAPDGHGFEHDEDRLSLVRLYFRQKRFDDVVRHARDLLDAETAGPIRHDCLEMLALAHKRLHHWNEMEETWDLLVRESPEAILPRLELAKHHEHRTRNLPAAERICRETLELLETRAALDRDPSLPHTQAFRRRLERVQRKLAKVRGHERDWE